MNEIKSNFQYMYIENLKKDAQFYKKFLQILPRYSLTWINLFNLYVDTLERIYDVSPKLRNFLFGDYDPYSVICTF